MPKTIIYLIRHAETVGNAEGIIQGQTIGGKLSKHGIRQAWALGKWAEKNKIDVVYSSTLSRAVETAKIAFPNAQLRQMDGLMEQDAGELSAKTVEEAFKTFHKMHLSGAQEPEHVIDYYLLRYGHELGGESAKDVQERGMKALEEIAKANEGKSVAVVAHGNLIKCILCEILGTPLSHENFRKMIQENCGINTITYSQEDGFAVESINYAGHLSGQ